VSDNEYDDKYQTRDVQNNYGHTNHLRCMTATSTDLLHLVRGVFGT